MADRGIVLDRFEVVRELGLGGAGELLLVTDRKRDNEPCALKILRPRSRDPALGPLFRHEFILLSEIRHDSIVGVRDFGFLETGEPFFTMDYIPGEPRLLRPYNYAAECPGKGLHLGAAADGT